jgi:hypothetical protein
VTGTDEGPAPDSPAPEGGRGPLWRRGGVALILLIAAEIGLWLTWPIALVQFGWMLVTDGRNGHLAAFGAALWAWVAEVVRLVSCTSEDRPFPWAPCPKGE